MAQPELSAPFLGDIGRATHWEPIGAVGEPPIDIWSRLTKRHGSAPSTEIRLTPAHAQIANVLSRWRAAEMLLADHIEASPMRSLLQSEIARLRLEYQRLFAQALR